MGDRGASGLAYITIPTDGGSFPLVELQYEIAMFRGFYVRCVEQLDNRPIDDFFDPEEAYGLAFEVSRYGAHRDYRFFFDAGFEKLPERQDLVVEDLRRNNPIELIVGAMAFPLAAAVILSGGNLELGPLKVKLPPLGTGIEALRKSLRPLSPGEVRAQQDRHTPRRTR